MSDIASDPLVLERFYRRHIDRVQNFVTRRVSDPHLAADLTADIFVAAIGSASTYRPDRASEIGWLYGVAYHVIAADRRRAARRSRAHARLLGRRLLEDDDIDRLEERIDAQREARRVYETLGQLSTAERAVLELVSVDGLSIADAAAALAIRPGTARVRLHRAREKVRDHLTPTQPARPDRQEAVR